MCTYYIILLVMITSNMNEIVSDEAIDSYVSYVSLIDLTTAGTQSRLIAEIFNNQPHVGISKREVERQFAIRHMSKNIKYPIVINCIQDLLDILENAPGDLQRTLRTFFEKFSKYGLHKQGDGDDIVYTFNPIPKSECEAIVRPALRNIFKNKLERDGFIQSKGGKCQLCLSTERLAIDHWRAHSVYNIDDPKIAILLCEKCNNTHHNFDASHCIKKNKDLLSYLRNWIKIEKEIRGCGFQPNEVDLNTQRESMVYVNNYYCQNEFPLPDSFWEGLL